MQEDVIIIGGGPIGLACGIEATKRGLRYRILEKGCLVNAIYNYPKNMTFFSTSVRLEIGEVPFISHGIKPTRTEALEYYRRVKSHWDLKVNTYEKVLDIIDDGQGQYLVKTTKATYSTYAVVIATGFYDLPNLLGVEGENLPKVKHYFDEPHPYADQKIIIVGGGNSAVDVALETYRRGAEVTMVIRKDSLKKSVKYWVLPDIENRIKEGSIQAYFNSTIKEIKDTSVQIQTPEGIKELDNDFVLAMTGYRPDFQWLTQMGLQLTVEEKVRPLHNESTFESNRPHIYYAGVVCGGLETNKWFIENARFHAEVIMEQIEQNIKNLV